MKQLIEGGTIEDDATLWESVSRKCHIQWELMEADVWVVDANWKLKFLLFHLSIYSFGLSYISTLSPYC